MPSSYPDLTTLLQEANLVTKNFLTQLPKTNNLSLFTLLIDHHIFSEYTLQNLFSKKTGLPIASLESLNIDPTLATKIKPTKHYIPLYETPDQLTIAVSNPYEKVLTLLNKDIQLILVPSHEINEFTTKQTSLFSAKLLIKSAYQNQASDIHCYEQENHSYKKLKFR